MHNSNIFRQQHGSDYVTSKIKKRKKMKPKVKKPIWVKVKSLKILQFFFM